MPLNTPRRGKIEVILEPISQLEGQLDRCKFGKDTVQVFLSIYQYFLTVLSNSESTQPQIVGTGVGLALCRVDFIA